VCDVEPVEAPSGADGVGPAAPARARDRDPGADHRLELVLSEALRALAHQQSLLDNVRSRATILTGAAALVASLLGAPALQREDPGWPTVVALFGLVGVLVCTMGICVPWWRWYFRSSASALLAAVDAGHSYDSMCRHLSADLERWVDRNDRTMLILHGLFTAGLVFLFAEIGGWASELVRTGAG
jgi:hypothetical protein